MRTIKIKVYTIEDHPNVEKCYEWIRNNWHDLNNYSVDELVKSCNALNDHIGGNLKYSISAVPDRGEHITFTDYDSDALSELQADECPLTGVCWDQDVIEALQNGHKNFQKVLDSLHSETEHVYSNDGLYDLCVANEYEFTEDGKFYS